MKKTTFALPLRETETDSDPVVESDTTEHSGDDDGVSWPSDEDERPIELPPKNHKPRKEKVDETLDGGVPLVKEPVAVKDGKNGRVL